MDIGEGIGVGGGIGVCLEEGIGGGEGSLVGDGVSRGRGGIGGRVWYRGE